MNASKISFLALAFLASPNFAQGRGATNHPSNCEMITHVTGDNNVVENTCIIGNIGSAEELIDQKARADLEAARVAVEMNRLSVEDLYGAVVDLKQSDRSILEILDAHGRSLSALSSAISAYEALRAVPGVADSSLKADDLIAIGRLEGAVEVLIDAADKNRQAYSSGLYGYAVSEMLRQSSVDLYIKAANLIAIENPRRSLDLVENLLAFDPENIRALELAGKYSSKIDRFKEALDYYERGIAFLEKSGARNTDGQLFNLALFNMYAGGMRGAIGDDRQQERYLLNALKYFALLNKGLNGMPLAVVDYVANINISLGGVYSRRGRFAISNTHYMEAKRICEDALRKNENDWGILRSLTVAMEGVGQNFSYGERDYKSALSIYLKAFDIAGRILSGKKGEPLYALDYGISHTKIASMYYSLGRNREAIRWAKKGDDYFLSMKSSYPSYRMLDYYLAYNRLVHAQVQIRLRDYDGAVEKLKSALAITRLLNESSPESVAYVQLDNEVKRILGDLLEYQSN